MGKHNIKVEYSEPWLDYVTGTYEKRFNLKMLFTYRYTLTVWEKNASADKKWNQLFQVRTGVEFEEAILHLWESLLFFMKNPKPDSLWEEKLIDYNVIEAMFTVGDRISSGEFMHFGENNFFSESFDGQTIVEITPEEMIMDSGDRIPLGKIVHMYANPTKEMLSYNKDQIIREFLGILNEAELADFSILSEEALFDKYGKAIIGRT